LENEADLVLPIAGAEMRWRGTVLVKKGRRQWKMLEG
jgi:hypothetical protein